VPTNPLTPDERFAVEDLLTEFAWRVDHGEGTTLHELFVEDGVIETPQFRLDGAAAIRERFTARAADTSRVSRHYWSNLRLSRTDEGVSAITNALTIINLAGASLELISGSSHDLIVRRGEGWAFRHRRLEVVFAGPVKEMPA
jgi:hypothetical protein